MPETIDANKDDLLSLSSVELTTAIGSERLGRLQEKGYFLPSAQGPLRESINSLLCIFSSLHQTDQIESKDISWIVREGFSRVLGELAGVTVEGTLEQIDLSEIDMDKTIVRGSIERCIIDTMDGSTIDGNFSHNIGVDQEARILNSAIRGDISHNDFAGIGNNTVEGDIVGNYNAYKFISHNTARAINNNVSRQITNNTAAKMEGNKKTDGTIWTQGQLIEEGNKFESETAS